MLPLLAALGLLGSGVALAQDDTTPPEPSTPPEEPPAPDEAPAPPPEAPPAPPDLGDLDADIAAFLGEDPATAAPPPPPPVASPNALNPRITAFGDILTTIGVDDEGLMPGSGPWVRSFELDLRADVDPYAKAVAVIAVEQEAPALEGHDEAEEEAEEEEEAHGHGAFAIAPEELYIDLVGLPAGFSARVGQFKLPFGLTNRMHPHDWAWPDAPLPFAEALGEEGMAEVAAVAAWRVPNRAGIGLTIEGGATGGNAFDPHGESATPGYVGRLEYFQDYGQVELGAGVSTVGQTTERVDGADLMLRWRKDSWHSVVLMGEAFRPVSEGEGGPVGVTSTLQVQPTRPVYLGARVDMLDGSWQYAGFVSYYSSEFLRLRAGATTDLDTWLANLQLTFVWGSHPVEPYWVNR